MINSLKTFFNKKSNRNSITPLMSAWTKDAADFELPYDLQKGLIFLLAFSMRAREQIDDAAKFISSAKKLSNRIRNASPYIDPSDNFDSSKLNPILTELAERSMGSDFSPRVLKGGIKAWDRNNVPNQLPECLNVKMWRLSDWDKVMTSLCLSIGKDLNVNLEGAYLAGFLYFDEYYVMDIEATQQISVLTSSLMPPKLKWFTKMLHFSAEQVNLGNPINKILGCFLDGAPPLLSQMVYHLSDGLHYESVGEKRMQIWNSDNIEFVAIVAQQQLKNWFESDTKEAQQALAELRQVLLTENLTSPLKCIDQKSAVEAIAKYVNQRWGYNIFDTDESFISDRWTRRSCIVFTAVVFSVLNPKWNEYE
jgi:hypothetical protein